MNLFDRIPSGLFGPLTGRYSRRAWRLISRLGTQWFGPETIPPYPDGYLHEQVTKEIERFLLDERSEHEGVELLTATPLNIHANELLTQLVESGWLVEDRVGAKVFIGMRPIVVRFFEALQQFADEGPQLVGGNVQMVHNQLRSVAENPRQQAQGFISAASVCVRLINALNATTLRARDLMKELALEDDTPVFVRRFFSEHIAELYVRDFKDLRTENHPLRLRWDIIELVRKVTTEEPARTELLDGYRALANPGEDAEQMLEHDVSRFERLLDVEAFIERMDRVMDQATQRAIAYLGYRLKASDRIEAVIEDTMRALHRVEVLNANIEGRLFPPASVVCDLRLRMPVASPPKPVRRPMHKREMTVRERALLLLRREMTAHRDGSPKAMQRYVESLLPTGGEVLSQELPDETVEDAVAYLSLMHLGSIAQHNPKSFSSNPLLRRLGFEVRMDAEGRRSATSLYDTPAFTVKRSVGDAA